MTDIYVDVTDVSDAYAGNTDNAFKQHITDQINGGNTIIFKDGNGQTMKKFATAGEFGDWFDNHAPKPDPAESTPSA